MRDLGIRAANIGVSHGGIMPTAEMKNSNSDNVRGTLLEPEDLALSEEDAHVQARQRQKMYIPDAKRLAAGDWTRADGNMQCPHCGCYYYEHPTVFGAEWLRRICNGNLVKL